MSLLISLGPRQKGRTIWPSSQLPTLVAIFCRSQRYFIDSPFLVSPLFFSSVDLGDHEHLSMTWPNVTVPSGTVVMLSLLDSGDQEAWSGVVRHSHH